MLFFAPTEADLTVQNIDKMLKDVLDWHTLGIKLGLPVYTLGAIRIDYIAHGTARQRHEMITKWLEYDTEASWDKLANGLKQMGKHAVATKIGNTYMPGYGGRFARDLHSDKNVYCAYGSSIIHLAPICNMQCIID